jgi:hypothetical protein
MGIGGSVVVMAGAAGGIGADRAGRPRAGERDAVAATRRAGARTLVLPPLLDMPTAEIERIDVTVMGTVHGARSGRAPPPRLSSRGRRGRSRALRSSAAG